VRVLLGQIGRQAGCGWPVLAICVLGLAVAGRGSTLYTVDLPSGGLVNALGAGRSNFDWINCGDLACDQGGGAATGGFIYGDSFSLAAGNNYVVTSISVFAAANFVADNTPAAFQSEFSAINLYFGDFADQSSACAASDSCIFSLIASNPLITPAGYTGGANCTGNSGYLATDGITCVPIYEVTFSVNLPLIGGNTYQFAADGVLASGLSGCVGTRPGFNGCGWYTLATTTGPDQTIYGWDSTDFSGGSAAVLTSPLTDMNVIVTGDIATPEPGSLALAGLGVAAVAVGVIRRRRRAV
jgi:hypothetical protein